MKCKKDIHQDDLLVSAPMVGSDAVWHPGCFECSVCNQLLADLIYCHKDGKIFCVRHFGEELKPRCCMCDEVSMNFNRFNFFFSIVSEYLDFYNIFL